MPSPFVLAKWEGLLLFAGFLGIIGWKLATRGIALDQLFEGDIRNRDPNNPGSYASYVSVGRIQSFWITVFVAVYLLSEVIRNPSGFPTIPDGFVWMLAGAHGAYLIGKAQAMLLGPLRDFLK